jgi:methylated-DNA-[protein]-cysteine S-methyltransferase
MARFCSVPPEQKENAMKFHFAKAESPVGTVYIVADESHLRAVTFHTLWSGYKKIQPNIEERDCAITRETARQLNEYFDGTRREFELPYKLIGTEFQKKVWTELARIPFGETRTYGEQAKRIGKPSAVRAVGGTNGRNPLWIILPCHRVIGANGRLTGYAGGFDMKQFLLRLEGHEI